MNADLVKKESIKYYLFNDFYLNFGNKIFYVFDSKTVHFRFLR